MPPIDLSADDARRIALAAQGFARPRPARVGPARLLETVRRIGLLQLDPINVLVPAHYLPAWSRLGPYDRAALDALVHPRRALAEQWAHAASIVPVEHVHLMRGRNEDDRRGWALATFVRAHPAFCARVLDEVRARGPVAAEELADPPGAPRPRRQEWGWTMAKRALEGHLALGAIAVAGRRADRSRLYDLAERVLGDHARPRGTVAEAQRALLALAARALGVATAADLVDYYRLPGRAARARIAELVEAGALRPVRVDGWREPAYLAAGARAPRRVEAAALVSPFDPLVWFRPRAARLWGFEYRIEIYTPPAKRRWGYYVLPFLLGDAIVARVDLKADRAAGRLLVQAAHLEPGAPRAAVADALGAELRALAGWLGLDGVTVARRGDLARVLAGQLRG